MEEAQSQLLEVPQLAKGGNLVLESFLLKRAAKVSNINVAFQYYIICYYKHSSKHVSNFVAFF